MSLLQLTISEIFNFQFGINQEVSSRDVYSLVSKKNTSFILTGVLMIITASRHPKYISHESRIAGLSLAFPDAQYRARDGFFKTEASCEIPAHNIGGCLTCFFCGMCFPTELSQASMSCTHKSNSPKCMASKLININVKINNTMSKKMTKTHDYLVENDTALQDLLANEVLVDYTCGFGFSKGIVQLAIIRKFLSKTNNNLRCGDIIEELYRYFNNIIFPKGDQQLDIDAMKLVEMLVTTARIGQEMDMQDVNEATSEVAESLDIPRAFGVPRLPRSCEHLRHHTIGYGEQRAVMLHPCNHIHCDTCYANIKTRAICGVCLAQVTSCMKVYL